MSVNNCITNNMISSCADLRKLNITLEKNKKNEERATELKEKYIEAISKLMNKDETVLKKILNDPVTDRKNFNNELTQLKNGTYYNYTDKNTFEDTILHMVEWFKDYHSKITFKSIEKTIEMMIFEKDSSYLIKNILENPMDFISIQHSCITFNQAYRITKELNIIVSDTLLIEKWAIHAVQDNSGSFYKIKSHTDSKNKYKHYNDRPFKQGWYWLLRKFCQDNDLLDKKYKTFLNILNGFLVEHTEKKHLYGIKDFVDIEKTIGDLLLELYYSEEEDSIVDEDKFNRFIRKFESNKSTPNKPFKFNDEQIDAIKHTITDKLSIITGPPGTGKSTIIEATIEWFNENNKSIISLQALIGKALKGLIEKCVNIKDNTICGTLHKCLLNTFPKIQYQSDNITRDHKIKYPQTIDIIVCDEFSMVDIFMFKRLLYWCSWFDCKLILCGDIDQLPPVGKGRPFECIINSKLFNTIYLTEIKRQDSGKLKDCIIKINKKELSIHDFDNISTIFIQHDFIDSKETSSIFNTIVTTYGRDNVGCITPENNKSPGVFEMNKLLQNNVYNSDRIYQHNYFKEGDYVMRTENSYDQIDSYGENIIRVNGDTGIIYFTKVTKTDKTGMSYQKNIALIKYDSAPDEEMNLNDIKDKLTLNYCNTVHKYQGSQKKVVVFIASSLHSSLSWGTNRLKLAYTAISRATETLIILGDKNTFFNIQNCNNEPFVTSFMEEFNEYSF